MLNYYAIMPMTKSNWIRHSGDSQKKFKELNGKEGVQGLPRETEMFEFMDGPLKKGEMHGYTIGDWTLSKAGKMRCARNTRKHIFSHKVVYTALECFGSTKWWLNLVSLSMGGIRLTKANKGGTFCGLIRLALGPTRRLAMHTR